MAGDSNFHVSLQNGVLHSVYGDVKAIKPPPPPPPLPPVQFIALAHFYRVVFCCIDLLGAMLPWRLIVLMCCIFTSNLKLLLLFQADPTKVETVQDVLARAAAKGLLGGIIPEQSKAGKKGKSKKNRAASATSKPSSPSSQERPAQTGSELESGQDPVAHSDYEEEKGEGDVKCSAEEEGEKNAEDNGGKGEKKRRGLKGRKGKLKRRSKQTNRISTVSKLLPKSHKKKPRKKNQAHHKRRLQGPTKSKPRRIPRLTLTLISSAKPSTHLFPIISQDKSDSLTSAGKHPSPARPAPPLAPHTSSKQQVQKRNTEPERVEKSLKETAKPGSPLKGHMKVIRPKKQAATQEELKPAGFVLPPISSPTSSSLSSRSAASLSQPPSMAFHTQHAHPSTSSSSSVSLPSLDKLGV